MPTWPEFATAMFGCYRLLRGDMSALSYFDRTQRGFWRSFAAAVFCIVPHFWLITVEAGRDESAIDGHFYLAEALIYSISWLAFPLVMIHMCTLMSSQTRYFDYMVPYNWMSVPLNYLVMLISVTEVSGLLPSVIASFGFFAAFGLAIWVLWGIAKNALDITTGQAAAIVGFDLVFTHFLTDFLGGFSG